MHAGSGDSFSSRYRTRHRRPDILSRISLSAKSVIAFGNRSTTLLRNASMILRCQIASNRDPLSRPILTPWRHESSGPRHRDNQDENAPPLSLRIEGVARTKERQRRRAENFPAWPSRRTCRRRDWRRRAQERFLNRQLVLPVSTISQWCVSRSSMAVVILASPNTCGQSAKARFVVISSEVFS